MIHPLTSRSEWCDESTRLFGVLSNLLADIPLWFCPLPISSLMIIWDKHNSNAFSTISQLYFECLRFLRLWKCWISWRGKVEIWRHWSDGDLWEQKINIYENKYLYIKITKYYIPLLVLSEPNSVAEAETEMFLQKLFHDLKIYQNFGKYVIGLFY